MPNPIILIHGYSAEGRAFENWKSILKSRGFANNHIVTWQSLVNEINIPDIAEGFDRALRTHAGLSPDEPFDAIVHSTGMLVIREWLACSTERIHRLKRLVALAPATFGSPVAKKGRGVMGAIIKGKKLLGPDFLEAGVGVLDALELGSSYVWNLSDLDLFGDLQHFGKDGETPYVFAFCGDKTGFISNHLAGPGSDGVVRIAGASLNTRKIVLDFGKRQKKPLAKRITIAPWTHEDSPVVPVRGADHGSIMDRPDAPLIDLVCEALAITSWTTFTEWHERAAKAWWTSEGDKPQYQQIITHAVDERGYGISDYAIKLFTKIGESFKEVSGFDKDVAAYSKDSSYRCFHLDLKKIKPERFNNLWLKVVLATNTHYVAYTGYEQPDGLPSWTPSIKGLTEASLDISGLLDWKVEGEKFSLFYPRTTTFLEMIFDREPMPLNRMLPTEIVTFD